MSEKIDVNLRFNVTESMMARILRVMREDNYTQSEYLREAVRRDLDERDRKLVSQHLKDPERVN